MLHFRPPENQWLEMTLFILFPPLHVGQGSDGTSVSAPFSIGSGWREGGLPHIWRSAVGRRPRQPGSWATAISMEPPQVVSQAWWLGLAGLLRISSGILRCIPEKGIMAEAVSLCTAWLWLSGGVPSALPSAHPVLREMGHRCGLWPEEGRGHVLSGARQGEAGAAMFGKHSPASPSAQTLPLNVVLGKNS